LSKKNDCDWSVDEKKDFLRLLAVYGPVNFGLISLNIPGRTGRECQDFYYELVTKGEIIDRDLNLGIVLKVAAFDEGMEMITEGSSTLYIGNVDVAKNLVWLSKNVEAIVNVSEDIENFYNGDFSYLRIPVSDSTNAKIIKYFDCANQFIREKISNGGSVLVHCELGDSRSVAIILSYLMKYHKFTLKEAIDNLHKKGISHIFNKGFLNQLTIFEKRVHGKNSIENVSSGKRKIDTIEQENVSSKKTKT